MAHGRVHAQAIHALGKGRVEIDNDGRVLVTTPSPSDAAHVRDLLGADRVRVAERLNVLLVDSEGIEWTWERRRILGMRGEQIVHEHAVRNAVSMLPAAEDASGTLWFVSDEAVHRFDADEWTRFPVQGLSSSGWLVDVSVSTDRKCVYFVSSRVRRGAIAFAEYGDMIPIQLGGFDEPSPVSQVVPLEGGLTATMPGCRIVQLSSTPLPPGAGGRERRRSHSLPPLVDCAIGEFVLPGESTFVHSHGGPLVVRTRDCRESTATPPRDWELLHTTESLPRDDRRLVSCGQFVLLHVDRDRNPRRATPIEEAFEPTYVERSGRLWRHRSGHRNGVRGDGTLAYLSGESAVTLVNAGDGEPVAVQSFVGVGAAGRAYFSTNGELHVFDPLAPPNETSTLSWRSRPVECWTHDREAEARRVVKDAVMYEDVARAHDVATRFADVERARPSLLDDPRFWREITSALTDARSWDRAEELSGRARACDLVGASDMIDATIEAEWARVRSGDMRGALEFAAFLEARGDARGGLDVRKRWVGHMEDPSRMHARQAYEFGRHAAKLRELDLALEWLNHGLDDGAGHETAAVSRAIRAVKAARRDPETLESDIALVHALWFDRRGLGVDWRARAHVLDAVLDNHRIESAPYRFVMSNLIESRIRIGDLAEARRRSHEFLESVEARSEPALGAQYDLAEAMLHQGDHRTALAEYELLRGAGAETSYEHRARVGIARAHMAIGDPRAAYRTLQPLVDLAHDDLREAYSFDLVDCHWMAVTLAEALEALDRPMEALVAARAARDRFPNSPRFHVHGHGSRRTDEVGLLIRRLEARLAK